MYKIVRKKELNSAVTLMDIEAPFVAKKAKAGQFIIFRIDEEGERIPLNKLWNRRQSTKFNGTSYITQRAAEAIYTPEGQRQIKETIDYYMDNARTMKQGFEAAGLKVYGGVNAPYIWLKTPDGTSSWRFFEQMLYEANVVGTPGVGFGPSGEGYIRLTAFGKHEDCVEAMKRIWKWLK